MYNFSFVKTADFLGFESLFYHSEPLIDLDVWELFNLEHASLSQRLLTVRETINNWLKVHRGVSAIYVEDSKNTPIKYDVTTIFRKNDLNYLDTRLSFTGRDFRGSKAWLHEDEYNDESKEFLMANGVGGRTGTIKPNETIHTFLKKIKSDRFIYTEEVLSNNNIRFFLTYT